MATTPNSEEALRLDPATAAAWRNGQRDLLTRLAATLAYDDSGGYLRDEVQTLCEKFGIVIHGPA